MIYVALGNKLMAFIIGIFLRNEIASQIRGGSRTFKGMVGGTTSAKGASSVGVSGAISIPSILRLISCKNIQEIQQQARQNKRDS